MRNDNDIFWIEGEQLDNRKWGSTSSGGAAANLRNRAIEAEKLWRLNSDLSQEES